MSDASHANQITFGIDDGQVVVTVARAIAKQAPLRLRLAPAEAQQLGARMSDYAHAAARLSGERGATESAQ